MDNGWNLLIGIIVVTGGIIGAIIVVAGMFYPAGFEAAGIAVESTYTYELTITNDHDLDGFELMVPLPSQAGDTALGNAIAFSGQTENPSGWEIIMVGDRDAVFLQLRAEKLSASASPHHLTAAVGSAALIDTMVPGNDPWQVSPAYAMTSEGGNACYSTVVYARFNAPEAALTSVEAVSSGRNTWRYPFTGGNSFTDHIGLSITGPASGWHTANGTITAGIGKYTLL
ncbi:MAG TPA: hypothetical protein ENN44_06840 [Methanoculleus sp.]|nr:hypothetical protein [Methanoculleus sp.]